MGDQRPLCGLPWPVCSDDLGQRLSSRAGTAWCPGCGRRWPLDEVEPCPWPGQVRLWDQRGASGWYAAPTPPIRRWRGWWRSRRTPEDRASRNLGRARPPHGTSPPCRLGAAAATSVRQGRSVATPQVGVLSHSGRRVATCRVRARWPGVPERSLPTVAKSTSTARAGGEGLNARRERPARCEERWVR
jgi:hypothetical protein